MKPITRLLACLLGMSHTHAMPITYRGAEPNGKHIVFLASDHEYRAEECCPAIARILSKHHGFTCTVVFGTDKEGFIEAGSSRVSGLEALAQADLFVIFARFLHLPDEQMAHIDAYLERGGPIVGLRTSSHAFKIPTSSPYAKYDYQSKAPGYENGFGHQILGNTWVGHYGTNHQQGSRILPDPSKGNHPILTGIKEPAFCHAGTYVANAHPDFDVLGHAQPLVSMDPDADADPNKPPMAAVWTRQYPAKDGSLHRVFHTTQGASQDILDPNFRRIVINGIMWAVGLESKISADLNIDFVGPYHPSKFSFNGEMKGVKPDDLSGFTSPIPPNKAP